MSQSGFRLFGCGEYLLDFVFPEERFLTFPFGGIKDLSSPFFSEPQERFNAITQFWGAYFERAGAHLGPYDRDLLNFAVKR